MIEFDAEWSADCDGLSCSLLRKKIVKEGENAGKERFENYGFYGSLKQVCQAYIQKSVQLTPGLFSAQQIVQAIERAEASVAQAVSKKGAA